MHTATDAPTHPGTANGPWRTGARFLQDRLARPLGVLVLLAALATLSYSNTFSASFHFDDTRAIVENPQIRSFSAFRDLSGSRYIGFLTFAANYHVGGLQVAGYHLVNLFLHVTNGVLVYTLVGLLVRTTPIPADRRPEPDPARGIAVATALLFVVHPIQTQAVTYIVQRIAILAALWSLLAVICYLQWRLAASGSRRRLGWYAGALVATLLAMKTKESSFTLPVLLVIVEGGFFRPVPWRRWGALLPFLVMLPLIPWSLAPEGAVGMHQAAAGFARETTDISRLSYFFTQCRVLVTYLRLLIWPVHQNLDYDYPHYDSLLQAPVFLSGLLLLGLAGLALYLVLASTRWRLAGFGVLWFFVTLSVESSLIPIRDVIYEHRLYLPSVGILVAVSTLAVGLLPRRRALALIVVGIVVAVFSVATYQRNRVWKDEITLWRDVVTESPKKVRGHINLGYFNIRPERLEEAVKELLTALQLSPNSPEAHNGLGLAYAGQGRWEEAIQEFSVAIQLKSDYSMAHNNLGNVYAHRGRLDEAIPEFMTALRLEPDLPQAHNNLGKAYLEQGRIDEAIAEFMTIIRLNPELPYAHLSLGRAYARQQRWEDAITEFSVGLRLKPDIPEAHASLGGAYAAQGRLEDAIQAYRTALRLKPDAPDVHNNLGILYARHGRSDEAMAEFTAALQLQPEFPEAHYNLGSVYARLGRLDAAIAEYLTAVRLKPDVPEVQFDLGNAYQLQGRTQEARRHFELAVRLQPDFAPAQQALAALDRPPHARR